MDGLRKKKLRWGTVSVRSIVRRNEREFRGGNGGEKNPLFANLLTADRLQSPCRPEWFRFPALRLRMPRLMQFSLRLVLQKHGGQRARERTYAGLGNCVTILK